MTLQHPVRPSRPRIGQPTWEVAQLYPAQGYWTVEEYLDLETKHLVEFDDGVLEFLPMPTEFHQCLMLFFYGVLNRFISKRDLGTVLTSPMKIRVASRRFREPDVLYMSRENAHRRFDQFWDGADLVMEVVSPNDPKRDLEDKRDDYAAAGIPEYWIIDPVKRRVLVLVLEEGHYRERGVYGAGRKATSSLLKGFSVDVSKLFKSADATRNAGGAKR